MTRNPGRGGQWIALPLGLLVLGAGYLALTGIPRGIDDEQRKAMMTIGDLNALAGHTSLDPTLGTFAHTSRLFGPSKLSYTYMGDRVSYSMVLETYGSEERALEMLGAQEPGLLADLPDPVESCDRQFVDHATTVHCRQNKSDGLTVRLAIAKDRSIVTFWGKGLPLDDVEALSAVLVDCLEHGNKAH